MRKSFLAVAVAALAWTAWSPGHVQAQSVYFVYPSPGYRGGYYGGNYGGYYGGYRQPNSYFSWYSYYPTPTVVMPTYNTFRYPWEDNWYGTNPGGNPASKSGSQSPGNNSGSGNSPGNNTTRRNRE